MKTILPVLAALSLVFCGCDDNKSTTSAATTNAPADPAAPGSLNYLGTLAAAEKSAVKTVDVASLNKAVQEFNVQEGRLPKDLTELVPAYIGHVPEVPLGYKLDYNPATGEVTVVKADN